MWGGSFLLKGQSSQLPPPFWLSHLFIPRRTIDVRPILSNPLSGHTPALCRRFFYSGRLTRLMPESSSLGVMVKPKLALSLSMFLLLASTSPSIRVRPRARAA